MELIFDYEADRAVFEAWDDGDEVFILAANHGEVVSLQMPWADAEALHDALGRLLAIG